MFVLTSAEFENPTPPNCKLRRAAGKKTRQYQSKIGLFAQLTQYTNADGMVDDEKDSTFKYGPYVKGMSLPPNPFNENTKVLCDATTNIALTRTPDTGYGWKFHFRTGVIYASDSTAHAAY